MISVYDSVDKCCGCRACAQVCGRQAISMKEDEYGFYYPVINQDKCVDCNLCRIVCNHKPVTDSEVKDTYVAQRKSSTIKKSASGGIFAEFASLVIAQGGVVYGCVLKREEGVLHPVIAEASTLEEVDPMLGSKYVQSDTVDSYLGVKKCLNDGKMVLYSGLPCQIAGLRGFLRKDYDNLLTLDIICHGAPNKRFFQAYISNLEKKIHGTVTKFNFRGKIKGWGDFVYTYTYIYTDKNGKHCITDAWGSFEESVYYKMFLASSIYRESCYHCPFTSKNRPSDITIGDCWGIDVEHPEYEKAQGGSFDFAQGTSCVIINTKRGQDFFATHHDGLQIAPVSLTSVVKYNHQLSRPSYDSPWRKVYYQAFQRKGYVGLKKMYYRLEWKQILKSKIYNLAPKLGIRVIHILRGR